MGTGASLVSFAATSTSPKPPGSMEGWSSLAKISPYALAGEADAMSRADVARTTATQRRSAAVGTMRLLKDAHLLRSRRRPPEQDPPNGPKIARQLTPIAAEG